MPYSSINGKRFITTCVGLLSTQTNLVIADFGAGSGTYSDLFRTKLIGKWHAVEIWEPYIEKFKLTSKYDFVHITDASSSLALLPQLDIVFIGDMLEHLPKNKAIELVNNIKSKLTEQGVIIVSVPIGEYPQGEFEGNPHEAHLATWYAQDLVSLGGLAHYDGEIGVAVLGHLPVRFAAYMITNDTTHTERALRSIQTEGLQTFVGITDNFEVLNETVLKYDGVPLKVNVLPWRFDDAKNSVLASIPLNFDYCISLDSDELLVAGFVDQVRQGIINHLVTTGNLPDVINHSFETCWDWEGLSNNRSNHFHERVHRRVGCHWIHPVHEKLKWANPPLAGWATAAKMLQLPDTKKSRSSYHLLLEQAVKEDPLDWKLWLFLADERLTKGGDVDDCFVQASKLPDVDLNFIMLKRALICEPKDSHQAITILTEIAHTANMRELWVWLAEIQLRAGIDTKLTWSNAKGCTLETHGYMRRNDCWDGSMKELI